jgi:hypothetical protein
MAACVRWRIASGVAYINIPRRIASGVVENGILLYECAMPMKGNM